MNPKNESESEHRMVCLKGPGGIIMSVALTKGPDGKWTMKHPGMKGLTLAGSKQTDQTPGKPPSRG